jgi:hypothetical protein
MQLSWRACFFLCTERITGNCSAPAVVTHVEGVAGSSCRPGHTTSVLHLKRNTVHMVSMPPVLHPGMAASRHPSAHSQLPSLNFTLPDPLCCMAQWTSIANVLVTNCPKFHILAIQPQHLTATPLLCQLCPTQTIVTLSTARQHQRRIKGTCYVLLLKTRGWGPDSWWCAVT